MKKNLYKLSLVLLLFGCNSKLQYLDMIEVDTKLSTPLDLSADSIEKKIIKLMTYDNYLIGDIKDIIFFKNNIMIYGQDNVSIFNLDGDTVTNISHKGKGPYEYSVISYATYNSVDKSFIIIDNKNKKMINYDIAGNPLNEERIGYSIKSIHFMGNCVVKCRDKADALNDKGYLINIERQNTPIERYLPFQYNNGERILELMDPITILSDSTFSYQSLFNDTVYFYDKKSLTPQHLISYKNANLPEYMKTQPVAKKWEFLLENDQKYGVFHKILFKKGENIVLQFSCNKNYYLTSYNTAENKSIAMYKNILIDDINLIPIINRVYFSYPYFILSFEPALISELPKESMDKIKKYVPKLYDAIQQSTINDNPILLLFKMP